MSNTIVTSKFFLLHRRPERGKSGLLQAHLYDFITQVHGFEVHDIRHETFDPGEIDQYGHNKEWRELEAAWKICENNPTKKTYDAYLDVYQKVQTRVSNYRWGYIHGGYIPPLNPQTILSNEVASRGFYRTGQPIDFNYITHVFDHNLLEGGTIKENDPLCVHRHLSDYLQKNNWMEFTIKLYKDGLTKNNRKIDSALRIQHYREQPYANPVFGELKKKFI